MSMFFCQQLFLCLQHREQWDHYYYLLEQSGWGHATFAELTWPPRSADLFCTSWCLLVLNQSSAATAWSFYYVSIFICCFRRGVTWPGSVCCRWPGCVPRAACWTLREGLRRIACVGSPTYGSFPQLAARSPWPWGKSSLLVWSAPRRCCSFHSSSTRCFRRVSSTADRITASCITIRTQEIFCPFYF